MPMASERDALGVVEVRVQVLSHANATDLKRACDLRSRCEAIPWQARDTKVLSSLLGTYQGESNNDVVDCKFDQPAIYANYQSTQTFYRSNHQSERPV